MDHPGKELKVRLVAMTALRNGFVLVKRTA